MRRAAQRIEKKKEAASQSKQKKLSRMDKSLANSRHFLSASRAVSHITQNVIHVITLGVLYYNFSATPVAMLPFKPFGILTYITHLGLPGHDYREVSVVCFYVLAVAAIKTNVKRILGFTDAGGGPSWQDYMDKVEKIWDEK